MAHRYTSMEGAKVKSARLHTSTHQEQSAALPVQTELKPSEIWSGKWKRERLSYHFELLNGSVSVGNVRLKLLLGFLRVSQLLPQNLFLFSHGRDLQGEKKVKQKFAQHYRSK